MGEMFQWLVGFLDREWAVTRQAWKPLIVLALIFGGIVLYGASGYYAALYEETLRTAEQRRAYAQEKLEDANRTITVLKARLDTINEAPKGFLQLDKIDIAQKHSLVEVGAEFGVNWHFINPGPGRALNVRTFYKSYVEDVGEQIDKKVMALFEKDLTQYRNSQPKGQEVGAGRGVFFTILTPLLTQQQFEGIMKGTIRMYFVVEVAWTDVSGTEGPSFYQCVWLQSDSLWRDSFWSSKQPKDLVWHYCNT